MWRVWGRKGGHLGSWWGKRMERDHWAPGRKWVNNIENDLQEVELGSVDWIGLPQDRE